MEKTKISKSVTIDNLHSCGLSGPAEVSSSSGSITSGSMGSTTGCGGLRSYIGPLNTMFAKGSGLDGGLFVMRLVSKRDLKVAYENGRVSVR